MGSPGHRVYQLRLLASALLAGAIVLKFAMSQDLAGFVLSSVIYLVLAIAISVWRGGPASPPSQSPWHEPTLWAMAIACVLVTLAAHRPDADDAFYVNMAVSALDTPSRALLKHDGIFGIAGMPIQLPFYRMHSFELLAAAVSRLTGLSPILALHWILAGTAAALVPLASAELFRRLLPRHWVLATFAVVATLLLLGETNSSYGNYAFVRLHQGKGVLVSIALPLTIAYALAFAHRPNWRNWMMLLAVQTAAVGLTASSLLVCPPVAALTLLVSWRYKKSRAWMLPVGLCAGAHAIVMLLALKGDMRETTSALEGLGLNSVSVEMGWPLLERNLGNVLGIGRARLLALFATLVAWSVPRSSVASRLMAALPLTFLLLFFHPAAASIAANSVLSPIIYFRAFWFLPLPFLIALLLTAPATLLERLRYPMVGVALSLLLLLRLATGVVETHTLSTANGTELAWPREKAPVLEFEAARWLAESTPRGAVVLAPVDVSTWVSTLEQTTHPLFSRYIYERFLALHVPEAEIRSRRTMSGFVSQDGHHLDRADVICYNADRFDLKAICLREFGEKTRNVTSQMAACGFEIVGSNERYQVWSRSKTR
jgi:hypothetical protein